MSKIWKVAGELSVGGEETLLEATWRGDYDPIVAYLLHDTVSYLGSSYICIFSCTGVVPTNETHWELVAEKGDDGDPGAASTVQGPQGIQGTAGTAGTAGTDGAAGSQGIQGVAGQGGATGSQGIQGIQGIQGTAGSNGTDGTDGTDGVDGAAGTTDYTELSNTPDIVGIEAKLDSVRPFPAPVVTATVVVPSAIDATGTTDVTAALQAVIDGAADGSLINFPAAGIYRITSALMLTARHNLIIDGHGCTIKYTSITGTDTGYSLFYNYEDAPGDGSDIWIRNFVLIGSSPYPGVFTPGDSPTGGQNQCGVIAYADRFEVSGCTISAVWGDGLCVDGGASGVWLHDNHVISAGRNGLSVIWATNVIAERNAFDKSGYHTFDIEPNYDTQPCTDIIFRNNTVGTYNFAGGQVFFGAGSTAGAVVDGIVVDGNVVTGAPLTASVMSVSAIRVSRITFTNNKGSVAAAGQLCYFEHVDGLVAYNNVQTLTSGFLMTISDCTKVLSIPTNNGYWSLENNIVSLVRLLTLNSEIDYGNCSGAIDLNLYAGAAQRCTLTGNVTFAFLYPPATPCFYTLKLIQDGTGGRTVTWPATVKGTPAINSALNSVSNILFYWDGTNYWTLNGLLAGQTATVAELNQLHSVTLTGNNSGDQTVASLSLQNVDNTSDATKNAAAVTITNHRFTRRVDTQATTDTITPEISTYDVFVRTAQAHALVINNHSSSTPVDGDMMLFEILGDATPRAITYGNYYVAKAGVALPAITVASKNLTLLFIWRVDLTQWVLLSAGQEA